MKKSIWVVSIVVLGLLSFAACSKQAPPPKYMEANGVKVELPALQEAFSAANPDQKSIVAQAASRIRYGQFEMALMELDKLSQDTTLTEPQKKAVATVLNQVKDALTKPAAKPTQ